MLILLLKLAHNISKNIIVKLVILCDWLFHLRNKWKFVVVAGYGSGMVFRGKKNESKLFGCDIVLSKIANNSLAGDFMVPIHRSFWGCCSTILIAHICLALLLYNTYYRYKPIQVK